MDWEVRVAQTVKLVVGLNEFDVARYFARPVVYLWTLDSVATAAAVVLWLRIA